MTAITDDTEQISQASQTPSRRKKKSSRPSPATAIYNKATSTQANRTVLLCIGGAVIVVLVARVSGTPGTKQLNNPNSLIKVGLGTGATMILLMGMAEIDPELAMLFAWLIFTGAFLTYGVDFARALSKGTLQPGAPPKGKVAK